MHVTITHIHKFEPCGNCRPATLADLEALERKLMSVLSDKIAEATAAADAALGRVQEDVTTLQAKVAELQAQVDSGLATPEDIAALESLTAKLSALDPVSPETLPEEPPAPEPEPTA